MDEQDKQSNLLLALAVVAGGFAALLAILAAEVTGMALGDANDAQITAQIVQERCQRDRQNAERYAKALAHVLNGGALEVEGATRVSCKAQTLKEQS